jgi:hypothetical protein
MVLVMAGCCPKIIPSESVNVRDSIRVEVVETIREVEIRIPHPVEREVNMTPDTTSTLQTSLARSVAELRDGLLYHMLENRQDTTPSTMIPVKDTKEIIYRDREVEKVIPYPVPTPLTKWQKFRMDVGGWAIGAICLLLCVFALKKFVFK